MALAACETTGLGTTTEAAKPVELPMTHTRAAEQCWMSTEKGAASMSLDKRADLVDKCIAEKMKTASGTAEPAPAAETKKPEAKSPRPKRKSRTPPPKPRKSSPPPADEKSDQKRDKDKKPAAEAPDKKP